MESKRETKYTKWVDIYNNHYRFALDNLKINLEVAPNDKIMELISEVYVSAIKTLKLYLRNNGLFKHTSLDVIKECFYIDFIENGEDWIEIYEYFESSNKLLTDSDLIRKSLDIFNLLDKNLVIISNMFDNYKPVCPDVNLYILYVYINCTINYVYINWGMMSFN